LVSLLLISYFVLVFVPFAALLVVFVDLSVVKGLLLM
jgi:hypothetical protein